MRLTATAERPEVDSHVFVSCPPDPSEPAPLRFPFTRDGFQHVLLGRDRLVCLVERTNLRTGSVHWEVVRLRAYAARTLPDGRVIAAGESYPGPSKWGVAGWTCTALADAERRYRNLVTGTRQKGGSATIRGVGAGPVLENASDLEFSGKDCTTT
jgi:hypothetical protein